jgi:hypothetical protein
MIYEDSDLDHDNPGGCIVSCLIIAFIMTLFITLCLI